MPYSINPQTGDIQYKGIDAILKTSAPTTSDTAYPKGKIWIDETNSAVYIHLGSGDWNQVDSTGTLSGPVSSTDNAIARWDGTGGNTLQDSNITIDDSDVVSGVTQLNVDNIRIDGNTISSTDVDGNINLTPNGSGVVTASSLTLTTDLAVSEGGTGRSAHTAYAVICGGTTTTGAQQSIASVGSSGQVLTSNGAGALPTFQNASSGSEFSDATFRVQDDGDATKEIAFQASGITTSTTRTITMPDQDIDLTPTTGSFQASDAGLTDIASLAVTDGNIIVGDGANWVAENGATARTSLGLGTSDSPQFADVTLGTGGALRTNTSNTNTALLQAYDVDGASYTTFGTLTAGNTPTFDLSTSTTIGSNAFYYASGTDVAVADGGTGASDAATARSNLGIVIGSDVQAYAAALQDIAGLAKTDGNIIVGDGANWVAESGATARTSLGLGTSDSPQFADVTLGTGGALRTNTSNTNTVLLQAYDVDGASYTTFGTLTAGNTPTFDLSTATTIGSNAFYYASGTDVAVTDGGTGASDASTARTNLGVAIGSDVQAYDATLAALASYNTNGVICQTAADTFAGRTLTGTANEIDISNGDGVSGNPTLSLSDTVDLSGHSSFAIPTSATPTVNAAGEIALDTTISSHDSMIRYYDGTNEFLIPAIRSADLTTTDGDVIAYDTTSGRFIMEAQSGGGGLSNVVEDTTPQLGGQLDVNGNAIGDGTRELLKFVEDASAVNELTVSNAATGNNPELSATGDDANVGIDLQAKGTGTYNLLGTSSQAAELRLYEDTDDGSNYTAFKVGTQSGNVTYTLPTADGSADQVLKTNGSGVLSWTAQSGGSSAETDRNTHNIALNGFRIAEQNALGLLNYQDGVVDEYENETDIDSKLGFTYNSSTDLYTATGEVLLHLEMEDTGLTDSGPDSVSITLNGNAARSSSQAKIGTYSAAFDGTGDYLSMSALDLSGAFTIEFWVYLSTFASSSTCCSTVAWNAAGFYVFANSGSNKWTVNTPTAILSSTSAPGTGAWTHIAVTRDSSNNMNLYVNGTSEASTTNATNFTGSNFYIGNDGGGSLGLDGYIDSFHVYDYRKYLSNFTAPTTEPSASLGGTLESTDQTAEATPTDARIILFEEDVDAITINTDLKAYASRDGGTTWTQITLTDEGTYATSKNILAGSADISGQPSGTTMRYKVESLNNKSFIIHGASLFWS